MRAILMLILSTLLAIACSGAESEQVPGSTEQPLECAGFAECVKLKAVAKPGEPNCGWGGPGTTYAAVARSLTDVPLNLTLDRPMGPCGFQNIYPQGDTYLSTYSSCQQWVWQTWDVNVTPGSHVGTMELYELHYPVCRTLFSLTAVR